MRTISQEIPKMSIIDKSLKNTKVTSTSPMGNESKSCRCHLQNDCTEKSNQAFAVLSYNHALRLWCVCCKPSPPAFFATCKRTDHHRIFKLVLDPPQRVGAKQTGPHYRLETLLWRYMSAMASQISANSTVCLTVCFRKQWRAHTNSTLLAVCEGNPPVTGGFPSQRASNAETISMVWRRHT